MMNNRERGVANRKKGIAFESKVRKELEKHQIVTKFDNNVDLENEELCKAGNKYIPGKGLMPGAGFPDFLCLLKTGSFRVNHKFRYNLKLIECKTNNILSKTEKLKMNFLINEGFDCWVAYDEENKVKFRRVVEYKGHNKICGKDSENKAR